MDKSGKPQKENFASAIAGSPVYCLYAADCLGPRNHIDYYRSLAMPDEN